jgi:tetratricopeptide (TPR) repeat protein
MFVVTFYSYKGGVGRTSALVKVAYRLARRGKRVFVLDFDLEAPGIDSYSISSASPDSPGLVEYISSFANTGKVPDLKDFVLQSNLSQTVGKLFVMRGGRKDEHYKTALGQLDWKVLYQKRRGFLLIENLRAAIQETFKPDYLFVDARTGLTDVSGICTLQLPQLVVLLFGLNEQSLAGISGVLRSIRGNRLNKEIKTLLVASPVPDSTEWVGARSARFESARLSMGSAADVVIPYDPILAFGEQIIDPEGPPQSRSSLARAYDLLSEKIISSNASDVATLLSRAIELVKEGQHELAEVHYRGVVDAIPASVEAWMEFGKFEKLRGNISSACEYFERAYSIDPLDCDVLAQLSSTYAQRDAVTCGRYFSELLGLDRNPRRITWVSSAILQAGLPEVAEEGFLRSAALDDKNVNTFIDLGEIEMRLGHYRKASEAYRRGTELSPNNLGCVFNLGAAYQKLDDPRALDHFSKATSIFEQMQLVENKTTRANVFEAISRAYIHLGKLEKAVELLTEAIQMAKESTGTQIFSSTTYQRISKEKFISDVTVRLQNLKRRITGPPEEDHFLPN